MKKKSTTKGRGRWKERKRSRMRKRRSGTVEGEKSEVVMKKVGGRAQK
jgi:hypothetical protein